MTRRYTAVLTALALVFVSLTPAHAALGRNQCSEGLIIPVQATSLDQGSFLGQLEITRFAREGNTIVAVGLVTGTLTDETGAYTSIVRTVKLPVDLAGLQSPATAAASDVGIQQVCDILHLTLGPLHLDLLGLIIDLNQVQLDITADPAGGLLGSLLCGLAGLLGGTAPISTLLNQIVGLLNQILAALG